MARSVMQHSFATVPRANIPRSSFNRSSGLKTTFDADACIPIYCDLVMPNDTFNMNAQALVRLNSPTLHPLMDNMKLDVHWFFVTCRHLWENWARMHGAQDDPASSIAFTTPVVSSGVVALGKIGHYMGLPNALDTTVTTDVNALPFRALRKVWNEWYRDENLQDSLNLLITNGPDNAGNSGIASDPYPRGKRYDYFTSALPWLQKGTSISLPLGDSILDVQSAGGNADTLGYWDSTAGDHVRMPTTGAFLEGSADDTTAEANKFYVDIAASTGPTLNDFRLAISTQRLLERDARSGTRYREHLLAHFGADDDDLRLGRSEFLGGGSIPIHINAVPNTSEDAAQKQGELTGYGMGSGSSGFVKTFKEWGYLLGIASAVGDITYSQGLDRMWSTSTRYDYPYPILANIGEEAILDKEIWHDAAGTNNEDVWGYTPRYEWLRFKNSRNTGLMDVDVAGTLASWHLQEDFAARPLLDSTFIENNLTTPLDRAIAIPSEPQFNADFYFQLTCARPLPVNGIPGLTRL